MTYADLLVGLLSYPDATPDGAIRNAAALARRLGGRATALAISVDIPAMRNRLANALVGLDTLAAEEEAKSAAQAQSATKRFVEAAAAGGLAADALVERAPLYEEGQRICEHARTRDLCLLSIGPAVLADRSIAEAVLFGSGRPVVIFPEDGSVGEGDAFGTVAVAWDGGARAARAVADALPVLKRAAEVRILIVTDEKPSTGPGAGGDLVRHLQAHGVKAMVDEVPAAGVRIGRVLASYVSANHVELLVMGGFGHSRAREFILGGATGGVLDAPPCPVLLSH